YLGTPIHSKRPPELDAKCAEYMRVNNNTTDIPTMVNINLYETVPKVEVTRLPEIHVPASGCQSRQNFETGIGRSISGPLMITYLHLPQQTVVTLAAETDSHSMNLGAAGQITTAIYLRSNQRLDFDSEIMYYGCRPDYRSAANSSRQ